MSLDIPALLRAIGKNFVLPIFDGKIDQNDVEKSPGNPVTIADIGAQILITRAILQENPRDIVFGEEYAPVFSKADQAIVDSHNIHAPLDPAAPFLALVRQLIAEGKSLPKSALLEYRPDRYASGWIIDPVDGTLPFRAKDPRFSMQMARTSEGRIIGGWIYRPVEDVLFQAEGDKAAEIVTFAPDGTWASRPVAEPETGPLSAMTVLYPHAHMSAAHDETVRQIFVRDNAPIPFEELQARVQDKFAHILHSDGYSYHHGELFLGHIGAVSNSSCWPWDQFAQAFIAQRAGYRVAFFDGQDYLGPQDEIPFVEGKNGLPFVRYTGGLLYAAPSRWDEINRTLHTPYTTALTERPHVIHLPNTPTLPFIGVEGNNVLLHVALLPSQALGASLGALSATTFTGVSQSQIYYQVLPPAEWNRWASYLYEGGAETPPAATGPFSLPHLTLAHGLVAQEKTADLLGALIDTATIQQPPPVVLGGSESIIVPHWTCGARHPSLKDGVVWIGAQKTPDLFAYQEQVQQALRQKGDINVVTPMGDQWNPHYTLGIHKGGAIPDENNRQIQKEWGLAGGLADNILAIGVSGPDGQFRAPCFTLAPDGSQTSRQQAQKNLDRLLTHHL